MDTAQRAQGFAFIELLIVIIIGILAAIASPMFLGQRERAKDAAVEGGVHQIELGLGSYGIDHGDNCRAAGDALTAAGLVDATGDPYVSPWPENPWTGAPMQHRAAAATGDFTYAPIGVPASSFTLTGHLSGGGTFVVP